MGSMRSALTALVLSAEPSIRKVVLRGHLLLGKRDQDLKITLIAQTFMTGTIPASINGTKFDDRFVEDFYNSSEGNIQDPDLLAEFAGRSCYQAWDLPNPKTANNAGYLDNIINQGHFSVLEHASATFYVEGVSRSLTHELIRHRHLSYSELSQRYVDVSDANVVLPPAFRENLVPGDKKDATVTLRDYDSDIVEDYEMFAAALFQAGCTRKQAREAARAILPNMTETKIVVTGNMRAWRDMLGKRYHVAADAEIREFATAILGELRRIAPHSFQDFPDKPFGSDAA